MLVWGPISRWYLGIWISGPNEISACIWIMNKQPFSKLVTVGYISERLVKDYKISLWHLLASYLLTHTHTRTHTPHPCVENSPICWASQERPWGKSSHTADSTCQYLWLLFRQLWKCKCFSRWEIHPPLNRPFLHQLCLFLAEPRGHICFKDEN